MFFMLPKTAYCALQIAAFCPRVPHHSRLLTPLVVDYGGTGGSG